MAETRRAEQKLWLILFQIRAIRTRLNLLAIQYWIFSLLAVLIAAGAVIFLAALALHPLIFATVVLLALLFTVAAIVRITREALRRGASPFRAASMADDRASLKGRLGTVLALADAPQRSSLWPYLVEDTYALRHQFEPGRIESRWISRSILALIAVCLVVAAISFGLRYGQRAIRAFNGAAPAEITADLGNLEISPADPSQEANARISGDPETLRQLRQKLDENARGKQSNRGLSRWMDKARDLAGNLQDQMTGRKPLKLPPLQLRLRDNNPESAKSQQSPSRKMNGTQSAPKGGDQDQNTPSAAPPLNIPGEQADQMARNAPQSPFSPDSSSAQPNSGPPPATGDTYAEGSGSSHGAGTDPAHLFGPPAPELLGSDTFKVTVDAEPSDEASVRGAPAYIPPKVRVPLNSHQFPDEPLARAAIPAEDRMTIKRVFER